MFGNHAYKSDYCRVKKIIRTVVYQTIVFLLPVDVLEGEILEACG